MFIPKPRAALVRRQKRKYADAVADALRMRPTTSTAAALWVGCSKSSADDILVDMLHAGTATREKKGRTFLYTWVQPITATSVEPTPNEPTAFEPDDTTAPHVPLANALKVLRRRGPCTAGEVAASLGKPLTVAGSLLHTLVLDGSVEHFEGRYRIQPDDKPAPLDAIGAAIAALEREMTTLNEQANQAYREAEEAGARSREYRAQLAVRSVAVVALREL